MKISGFALVGVRIAVALGGLFATTAVAYAWLVASSISQRMAGPLTALGWRILLAAFGIKIIVRGSPQTGALFVANHVSWIDIPILAQVTGAAFVAKAEVGAWPAIGRLARRYGCVFVDRGQTLDAMRQARTLAETLRGPRGLVLFPEGTTSDGTSLLPFRSSLFAAVIGLDTPVVQPVALVMRSRAKAPTAGGQNLIPWLGDDALLPHALRLAAHGGAVAEVWFEPPVQATTRKAMADNCRRAILARIMADQAGTLNRVA